MINSLGILKEKSRLALLFAALLFLAPSAAHAADQVVNNCSNDTELRADLTAIQAGGGGTLTFNCGTTTITLDPVQGPLPDIATTTTIDGGGHITLSGGGATRILRVNAGATLNLQNITLQDAFWDQGEGGAVRNNGTLNVSSSKFFNNKTTVNWSGGAIAAFGPTSITDSEFAFNKAANGGAFESRGSAALTTISGSSFHDNETLDPNQGYGGALFLYDGGRIILNTSTLKANHARFGGAAYTSLNTALGISESTIEANIAETGGGIYSASSVFLTIVDSYLRLNQATLYGGGGIRGPSTLTLINSTLAGNSAKEHGGGLDQEAGGSATLTGVTISGNTVTSGWGAGVENWYSIVDLTNTTISNNSASTNGGGIYNRNGNTSLTNVTLAGNSAIQGGGGIYQVSTDLSKTVTLTDTILANFTSYPHGNCFASDAGNTVFIMSMGSNLSNDTSCEVFLNQGSDLNNKDPHLGPLGNNGGPTQTHVLLPGSPAIDKGTACPSTDQRGVTRPQGPACDIGAVERQPNDGALFLPLVIR